MLRKSVVKCMCVYMHACMCVHVCEREIEIMRLV